MDEEVRRRLDLLAFWERHGSAAATEHGGVSIRTLYRWRATYRRRDAARLRPISRRPHRTRKREWPKAVTDEIRCLRTEHPNQGKRKIHPLLLRFCERRGLRCPAVITIGRLTADAGGLRAVPPRLDNRGRRKRPRPQKPRKPKGFRAQRPGEVLAVDTVIAVRDGVRRYLFARLDLRSRFGPAVATPGMSSRWARDFADLAFDLFPGQVDRVLSDNGSEYEGQFADLLRARGIALLQLPEDAEDERPRGAVQPHRSGEFLDYHEDLLWGDEANLALLNRKLGEWLLWYNGERPHEALGQRTPIAALARERSMLDHLPDRRRPESQNRRHPLPTARPVAFGHQRRKCQIHWARTAP